jgi:hypothetical protein
MLDDLDWDTAKALLEWQVELGATEAICDAPINRYELAATTPSKAAPAQSPQSPILIVLRSPSRWPMRHRILMYCAPP